MTNVGTIETSAQRAMATLPGGPSESSGPRGHQVMLDEDLSGLYGVETRRLVEQVKRNRERFPPDFMFQLTKEEAAALRSQSAISNTGRGGRRYAPYVFTEQGVAMLSSVLRSNRAVAVNITIMRTFVELRRVAASHVAVERRLEDLEREMGARLGTHDQQLEEIQRAATPDLATSSSATQGWLHVARRRRPPAPLIVVPRGS